MEQPIEGGSVERRSVSYAGIDYGMGQSNVNRETGIRYGVIAQWSFSPEALNDLQPIFAGPNCPACGGDVLPSDEVNHPDLWKARMGARGCFDYACLACRKGWDSGECFGDEAVGFESNDPEYDIEVCLVTDIIVTRSPFYTHAQYCSPCVPGAGNLENPCEGGPRTYALGHDWFEDGVAPYPVFRVSDDQVVKP